MYWKYVNHMSKHSEEESTFSVHFTEKFRQAERNRWRKMEDGFGVGWLSREVRSWRDRPLQREVLHAPGKAAVVRQKRTEVVTRDIPSSLIFQFLKNWRFFFTKVISHVVTLCLHKGDSMTSWPAPAMRIKAWRKPCDIRIAGRIAGVRKHGAIRR